MCHGARLPDRHPVPRLQPAIPRSDHLASTLEAGDEGEGLGFLMAQAIFAGLPVFIVYLFFQKYIVRAVAGAAISLAGRICAVADVLDSLVSSSCYKPAWPLEKALAEVIRLAGSHLDPTLVQLVQTHRADMELVYAG